MADGGGTGASTLEVIAQIATHLATAAAAYFGGARRGRTQAEQLQEPRAPTSAPGELDAGMSAVIRTLGLELQELRDQNRDFARQLRETEGRWRREREEHERQLAKLQSQVDERDGRIAQLLEQIDRLSAASC